MEELTKRNGKGVWFREIEKMLKRFKASLEWFVERIAVRDEELETIRRNGELEEREKNDILRAKRMKSISDVLEEVDILIDTHFFNEFLKTKSSTFLKKVLENRNAIDARLFRRTWRTLNCSPKTIKVIREILENLLCVGKRKELITKKKTESKCGCIKTGRALNAKHIL